MGPPHPVATSVDVAGYASSEMVRRPPTPLCRPRPPWSTTHPSGARASPHIPRVDRASPSGWASDRLRRRPQDRRRGHTVPSRLAPLAPSRRHVDRDTCRWLSHHGKAPPAGGSSRPLGAVPAVGPVEPATAERHATSTTDRGRRSNGRRPLDSAVAWRPPKLRRVGTDAPRPSPPGTSGPPGSFERWTARRTRTSSLPRASRNREGALDFAAGRRSLRRPLRTLWTVHGNDDGETFAKALIRSATSAGRPLPSLARERPVRRPRRPRPRGRGRTPMPVRAAPLVQRAHRVCAGRERRPEPSRQRRDRGGRPPAPIARPRTPIAQPDHGCEAPAVQTGPGPGPLLVLTATAVSAGDLGPSLNATARNGPPSRSPVHSTVRRRRFTVGRSVPVARRDAPATRGVGAPSRTRRTCRDPTITAPAGRARSIPLVCRGSGPGAAAGKTTARTVTRYGPGSAGQGRKHGPVVPAAIGRWRPRPLGPWPSPRRGTALSSRIAPCDRSPAPRGWL